MAEVFTWLITGASRGIGLETVRQLVSSPSNFVIATCRDPANAKDLQALKDDAKGKLHISQLDVSSVESIQASEKDIGPLLADKGLDYLLNNAAINHGDSDAFDFPVEQFMETMTSNVVGPAVLTQTYISYIEKSKRKVVMNMTSGLASIGLDLGPKCVTYSISKTALNMLTYKQSREKPNVKFVVIDPGWVKTAMGGEGAMLEPHESVSGILNVLKTLTPEQSGKFFRYNGSTIPW